MFMCDKTLDVVGRVSIPLEFVRRAGLEFGEICLCEEKNSPDMLAVKNTSDVTDGDSIVAIKTLDSKGRFYYRGNFKRYRIILKAGQIYLVTL